MVASPANPTGTLLTAAELAALSASCKQHGGSLIVDEIYHGLTYGCDAATALAVDPDVFVINSFSKYFQMTGWRLGWLVVPDDYVEPACVWRRTCFLSAGHGAICRVGCIPAEVIAELEQRRAEFGRRRDFLLQALPQLGWKLPVQPEGAFYLYADVSAVTADSFAYCERLLEEVNVAITPGRILASLVRPAMCAWPIPPESSGWLRRWRGLPAWPDVAGECEEKAAGRAAFLLVWQGDQ
jgi:aspartate/methionine/tyrosine aminotransferase